MIKKEEVIKFIKSKYGDIFNIKSIYQTVDNNKKSYRIDLDNSLFSLEINYYFVVFCKEDLFRFISLYIDNYLKSQRELLLNKKLNEK